MTGAHDVREEERRIDPEAEEAGRDEHDGPRPPARRRARLLRPLSLALIAAAITAAGFLGGVLAQKGGDEGSTASLAGSLSSLSAAKGGSETTGAGGSSAATSGTVTKVEGHKIYVKESDGTVVTVKVGDGATVTRDSNVAARKVHPGDSVTVEGSKHGSTVKATSVATTESGAESLFEE